MSWVDHIEGTLPADDLRRAFVAGAQWWEYLSTGSTMWQEDRNAAEAAAETRYPGGKPPSLDRIPDSSVAVIGNPPYAQTHSYEVLRDANPLLDLDDAPDPEEDA